MRRFTTVSVATMSAALMVTAVTAPASAGAERVNTAVTVPSLPGEITLPPLYGDELPNVQAEVGDTGTLFSKDRLDSRDDTYFYVPANGNPAMAVPPIKDSWNMVGNYVFWGPINDGSTFASQRYDLTTGEQITLRSTYAVNDSASFIAGTGTGWIDFQIDPEWHFTYTDVATRSRQDLGLPELPAGTDDWSFPHAYSALAVDEAGAVVELYAFGSAGSGSSYPSFLYYIDFATATWTKLHSEPSGASAALSANWIAWKSGFTVNSTPRSTPAAAPITRTYGDQWARGVALDGDTLATLHETEYQSGDFVLRAGAAGGPLATIPLDSRLKGSLHRAPGGGFVMRGGSTPQSYGLYRIGLDKALLDDPIVLFGATAPLGLEASAGRLLSLRSGKRTVYERLVTEPTSTSVKVHGSTTLVPTYSGDQLPDPSGGHSVYLKTINGHPYVVVQDASSIVQSIRVPDGSYEVTESGQRALVAFADPDGGGGGYWVLDLPSGAHTEVEGRRGAALWGQYLAYMLPDASVRLRDVVAGTARTIRSAGYPVGADAGSSFLPMSAFGDWVVASWSTGSYTATSEAINVVTGQIVPLTADTAPVLADNMVAWIDDADRDVHVQSLISGLDAVVGQARPYAPNREYVALTDEFVAWVAPDDTTRVLPLASIPASAITTLTRAATASFPFAVTTTPRYLGTSGSSIFSPNGDGKTDRFRPRIDTSRPLTSWRLDIRDAKGRTIRTLTGTAPKGNVRPDWNGLTTSGYRANSGTYSWRLTGTGADGPLRRSNGSSTAIIGKIKLTR